MVFAVFRTIFAQPNPTAVAASWDEVRDQLAARFPKIGPMMDDAKAEVLARCPAGWVCHADRAPGWKVTYASLYGAVSSSANRGWTRTSPVKYCAGPVLGACDPLRMITCGSSSSDRARLAARRWCGWCERLLCACRATGWRVQGRPRR
jgi:hypothetical protein